MSGYIIAFSDISGIFRIKLQLISQPAATGQMFSQRQSERYTEDHQRDN